MEEVVALSAQVAVQVPEHRVREVDIADPVVVVVRLEHEDIVISRVRISPEGEVGEGRICKVSSNLLALPLIGDEPIKGELGPVVVLPGRRVRRSHGRHFRPVHPDLVRDRHLSQVDFSVHFFQRQDLASIALIIGLSYEVAGDSFILINYYGSLGDVEQASGQSACRIVVVYYVF